VEENLYTEESDIYWNFVASSKELIEQEKEKMVSTNL
jgi:redox-sensitive bicupin YhaK (pirin superfamily)